MCFPSLRQRFRTVLARRVDAASTAAWQQAQGALWDHVEAVDRLAQQGYEALHTIDQLVQALARPAPDNREVQRLFGDPMTPAAALPLPATTPRPGPEPRRRPPCE